MKLAVIFPGIGYHADKPLLYYSKKLAQNAGYLIKEVPYGNFPKDVKGSRKKMQEAFQSALEQTENILSEVDFTVYEEVLFISKSVGTAVASAYAEKHNLDTRNVYYTPVAESFQFMKQSGIVFHGTKDGWADTDVVKAECSRRGYPLHIVDGANHSLETGDVLTDLADLVNIAELTQKYILNG